MGRPVALEPSRAEGALALGEGDGGADHQTR